MSILVYSHRDLLLNCYSSLVIGRSDSGPLHVLLAQWSMDKVGTDSMSHKGRSRETWREATEQNRLWGVVRFWNILKAGPVGLAAERKKGIKKPFKGLGLKVENMEL